MQFIYYDLNTFLCSMFLFLPSAQLLYIEWSANVRMYSVGTVNLLITAHQFDSFHIVTH